MPEPDSRGIDLWIITGFLGSGKTSVINALVSRRGARRLGVVVNDFGSIGVDATLLEGADRDQVVELNGGQIFCACLSGAFVQALTALAGRDLDAILVESSGLAKPRPMRDIVAEAERASDGRLRFRGMVGIVDADRIRKLRTVVNAVDEQLVHSRLILINKSDLVDADRLGEVTRSLAELCPDADIRSTSFGAVEWDALPGATGTGPGATAAAPPAGVDPARFSGWGHAGRPVAGVFAWGEPVDRAQAEALARRLGRESLRVKGYLRAPQGFWLVSVSGDQVEIRSVTDAGDRQPVCELSIIVPAWADLEHLIRESCVAAGIADGNRPAAARSAAR